MRGSLTCFVLAFPVGVVCGAHIASEGASSLWVLPCTSLFVASAIFAIKLGGRSSKLASAGVLFCAMLFALPAPAAQRSGLVGRSAPCLVYSFRISDALIGARRAGKLPTAAPWTPATSCCAQNSDGDCALDLLAGAFRTPPWQLIGFTGPERACPCQFRFEPRAEGYVVQARADLDCDGEMSLMTFEVAPDSAGEWKRGVIRGERELE